MAFRRRAFNSYSNPAATATATLVLGPFPPGYIPIELNVTLSGTAAAGDQFAAAWCSTDNAAAATFAAGTSVIQRSTLTLDGHPAIQNNHAANVLVLLRLPLGQPPDEGYKYLHVRVINNAGATALNVTASVEGYEESPTNLPFDGIAAVAAAGPATNGTKPPGSASSAFSGAGRGLTPGPR